MSKSNVRCGRTVLVGDYCFQHRAQQPVFQAQPVQQRLPPPRQQQEIEVIDLVTPPASPEPVRRVAPIPETLVQQQEAPTQKKVTHKKIPERERPKECAICLEEDFEKFKEFSCGHQFHIGCLEQIRNYCCPMCRKDIKKELPVAVRKKIASNRSKDSNELYQRQTAVRDTIRVYQRIYQLTGDFAPLQTLMMSL